jgi:hypothetical protein
MCDLAVQAASGQGEGIWHDPIRSASEARTKKCGTSCRGLIPDLSESRKGNFLDCQLSVDRRQCCLRTSSRNDVRQGSPKPAVCWTAVLPSGLGSQCLRREDQKLPGKNRRRDHVLYLISGKSNWAFLYRSSHSRGQPKALLASGLKSCFAAPLMKWMNSPQFILRV